MAEGDEERDPLMEHTDDKTEDDETFIFPPPVSKSTPHNPGETFEMQTRLREQSGLPDTSYQETAFGGTPTPTTEELQRRLDALRNDKTDMFDNEKIERDHIDLQDLLSSVEDQEKEIQKVKDFIKMRYPNAKLDTLKIRFSEKNFNHIVVVGPKGGETKILLDDGSGLLKSFLDKTFVKKALGKQAETVIKNTSADIRKRQKELESERNKKEQAEKSLREQTEKIMNLNDRLNKEKAKIEQMKDLPEYDEEIKRKKQLTQNLEKDLKIATQERKELEKKTKNIADQDQKYALLEASLEEEIKTRNAMEERLNQTKQLDALKEQESDLQRQNAEDQEIIQDENASPSDIAAARERVEERNEELARLQTQIEERERVRPLLERVKEIFKKYGVTVTAIGLAAGVTIGAVVSSITKASKATGKALGKGLKDISAKIASLLPGLIGSIASFLFKAAGQAIGFLAEHTWLLILAVVAFLVEKYIKKRR